MVVVVACTYFERSAADIVMIEDINLEAKPFMRHFH